MFRKCYSSKTFQGEEKEIQQDLTNDFVGVKITRQLFSDLIKSQHVSDVSAQ
jgi:hypothetical protein